MSLSESRSRKKWYLISVIVSIVILIIIFSSRKIEWEKTFTFNDDAEASSIIQTSKGGVIVVGYTDPKPEEDCDCNLRRKSFIMKLDKNGNLVWNDILEEDTTGYKVNSVTRMADGNFVAVGTSYTWAPFGNIVLASGEKFDEDDVILWNEAIGGFYSKADFVTHTTDGGFVVVIEKGGDIEIDKYDKNSNLIWSKKLRGPYTPSSIT